MTECVDDGVDTLGENVFDKFENATKAASDGALPTASGWGAHRDAGGLHYMTYKATVRRSGVYQGASGLRDFNSELTEPVYKQLASTWEKAFQRRLPHILQTFTKTGTDLLRKFHLACATRCRERGHGIARIGLLETQLHTYQDIFKDLANIMIAQINEGQREINREFTPVIAAVMEPSYDHCANERGTGSYKRMKAHMTDHVSERRVSMFTDATTQVRTSLMKMCDEVRQGMLDRADSIYLNMQRDYMSIIGGVNVDVKMPRQERALRRDVDEVIGRADEYLQEIVDADLDELKKQMEVDAPEEADKNSNDIVDVDDADDLKSDSDDEDAEDDEDNEDAGTEKTGEENQEDTTTEVSAAQTATTTGVEKAPDGTLQTEANKENVDLEMGDASVSGPISPSEE